MAKFDNHPTVKWWREQSTNNRSTDTVILNSAPDSKQSVWSQVLTMWDLWKFTDLRSRINIQTS